MRSSNKRSPGRGRTALNGILEISKPPPNPNENVAALQQQLKAARTRVHNLTVEKNAAWRARDEARKANPVTITKAQRAKLLKALHPDKEVSKERKEVLNAALQIFNGLRIRLIE
jgi:hypothetical protein